jgi:uncharacterized membrane protein YhaH (DUF805 family)
MVFIFCLNGIFNVALPFTCPWAYRQMPGMGPGHTVVQVMMTGFAFLSLLASLSLCGRRSHDNGKPGLLGILLPIILLGFLILGLLRGDPGPNRYGDGPFEPDA